MASSSLSLSSQNEKKKKRKDTTMFEHILVPLDGSSVAERALPVATRLAQASHGSIVLVRAVNSTQSRTIREAHLASAHKYLNQLLPLHMGQGLSIERIVRLGPATSTILATAQAHAIDLIIMCSHGYTGIARTILGSIAREVTHQSTVPILLLRAEGPLPTGTHPDAHRQHRILVGLDGSAYAKQALLPAASLIALLAAPAQGAVHLTRVITPSAYQQGGPFQQSLDDAIQKTEQNLCRTIENIRDGFEVPSIAQLDLQFTCSVAVSEQVAETLIRVAEQGEGGEGSKETPFCDLIALSTHGYSGLHRWALGSVTEHVLTRTKLPMLIVRPEISFEKQRWSPDWHA
jgi:nucleotide-binding universal stress UspA family protein